MENDTDNNTLKESYFFENGMYKKAEFCPKVYTKAEPGITFCGKEVKPEEFGDLKFDSRASISQCLTDGIEYIVETKFNGHRGILEFRDNKAGFFSETEALTKPLPLGLAKFAADYLAGNRLLKPEIPVQSIILDGELFLKECKRNGKAIVPDLGAQHSAIKGADINLINNCVFTYKIFDIINLNGNDLSMMPLKNRKNLIKKIFPKESVVSSLSSYISRVGNEPVQPRKNITLETEIGKSVKSLEDINKAFCEATNKGQEGIVIKNPESPYDWKNLKEPSRRGWWKIKEVFDVDAAVMKACLGAWKKSTKTNQHLSRYKELDLGVCADAKCNKLLKVATSQSSAEGSPLSGWDKWDDTIHYPIVDMILSGVAKPSKGTTYRSAQEIIDATERGLLREFVRPDVIEHMMGKTDKTFGVKTPDGRLGLPVCVDLPLNKMIVEVITSEIFVRNGKPTLGGPPRIVRRRDDKLLPNNVENLLQMYSKEINLTNQS